MAELTAEARGSVIFNLIQDRVALRAGQCRSCGDLPDATLRHESVIRKLVLDLKQSYRGISRVGRRIRVAYLLRRRGHQKRPNLIERQTVVDLTYRSALSGIDGAKASLGSCTTVMPPQSLIANSPAVPLSRLPVRTTPMTSAP